MLRRVRCTAPIVTVLLGAGCAATNTAEDTRHFPRDGIDVWAAARDAAREQPRWDEKVACPARGSLVYECRSAIWGFVDDLAVSVDPDPRGGTRVHLDSRSRVGRSDWGVNAKRIALLLDRMETKLAEHPETPTPAATAGVGSGSR
ncbi:MAG: DUF1499 domain-containing protein [Planctomycetota bacterium]